MTIQNTSWLPTPEQQAIIDEHWRNVRDGLHSNAPEPEYRTPKELVEMHRYLARTSIKQAARHMRIVEELNRGLAHDR